MSESSDSESGPICLSSRDFPRVVLASPKPAVVGFWAEWCGPCRTMRPIFDKLSVEFSGRALFASLNVDDSPDVAASFGVLGIPTFIVFIGGKPVETIVGACGEEALRKAVEKHLGPSPG